MAASAEHIPADWQRVLDARPADGISAKLSYKFAGTGTYAAPKVSLDEKPKLDVKKMSAPLVFANGNNRDREGDITEIGGIRTGNHQMSPIVMLDHGKHFHLPIGRCSPEPNSPIYTVELDTSRKLGIAETYFSQRLPEAEQAYALIEEGLLNAGSYGYRAISGKMLPPDFRKNLPEGVHLLETELVEVTWTPMPVNGEAVRACLSKDRLCGKSLTHGVKAMLLPFCPAKPAQVTGGWNPQVKASPMKEQHDMNAPSAAAAPPPPKPQSDNPATAVQPQPQEQHNPEEEKYGAQLLRRMYEDLQVLLEDYKDLMAPLEHDGVRGHAEGMMKGLFGMQGATRDTFSKHYPEYPALADTAADGQDFAQNQAEVETADQLGNEKPIEASETEPGNTNAPEPPAEGADEEFRRKKVNKEGADKEAMKSLLARTPSMLERKGMSSDRPLTKFERRMCGDASEFLGLHHTMLPHPQQQLHGLYHHHMLKHISMGMKSMEPPPVAPMPNEGGMPMNEAEVLGQKQLEAGQLEEAKRQLAAMQQQLQLLDRAEAEILATRKKLEEAGVTVAA